jgi:nicotinate phosphoribosyltransferase
MQRGRLLAPHPPLTTICDYCAAQVAGLPEDVRRFRDPAPYPVSYSDRLVTLRRSVEAEMDAPEVTGRATEQEEWAS